MKFFLICKILNSDSEANVQSVVKMDEIFYNTYLQCTYLLLLLLLLLLLFFLVIIITIIIIIMGLWSVSLNRGVPHLRTKIFLFALPPALNVYAAQKQST